MKSQPLDLSEIVSDPFRYIVSLNDGTKTTVEVDFDATVMQAQLDLPTVFKATGETDGQGNPVIGIHKIWKSFSDGEDLPPSLPNLMSVLTTFKRILKVPAECSMGVTFAVFKGWSEEMQRRSELKKNTGGSPVSQEATPASSPSETSTPTPPSASTTTSRRLKPART